MWGSQVRMAYQIQKTYARILLTLLFVMQYNSAVTEFKYIVPTRHVISSNVNVNTMTYNLFKRGNVTTLIPVRIREDQHAMNLFHVVN